MPTHNMGIESFSFRCSFPSYCRSEESCQALAESGLDSLCCLGDGVFYFWFDKPL